MKMLVETTLQEMRDSRDWKSVFADFADGFGLGDVAEVLGSVDGYRDGANWSAVLLLKDGRYAYVTAGCDYTGWDCESSGDSALASSLSEITHYLTVDDRSRLEMF